MIKITKKEMKYLIANGCKWRDDIHRTYSGHGIYYMTESKKPMKLLQEYRKKQIVGGR